MQSNSSSSSSSSSTAGSILLKDDELRTITKNKLQQLQTTVKELVILEQQQQQQQQQDMNSPKLPPSWINQYRQQSKQSQLLSRSEQCMFFDYCGFVHISNFVNVDSIQDMKRDIHQLVQTKWHPYSSNQKNKHNNNKKKSTTTNTNDDTHTEVGTTKTTKNDDTDTDTDTDDTVDTTFGTDMTANVRRGNYFLESSNRIHYFTEPNAYISNSNNSNSNSNNNNNNTQQQQQQQQQVLKSIYCNNETKIYALNKIGHALHTVYNSSFQLYTKSNAVRQFVRSLGYYDPIIPQSMYIFKQPNIVCTNTNTNTTTTNTTNTTNTNTTTTTGIVNSHQDSTFLYTTPYPTCLGLWLALDDATIENGCLWVRPFSHNNNNTTNTTTNINKKNETDNTNDTILPNSLLQQHNVRRQYRRNELYFGLKSIQERSNERSNNNDTNNDNNNNNNNTTSSTIPITPPPMFEMKTLFHDPTVPWDGSIPGRHDTNHTTTSTNNNNSTSIYHTYHSLIEAGFIPIECKAGDLLAFTGTLDHLSLENQTTMYTTTTDDEGTDVAALQQLREQLLMTSSRHTFQLHIVEGPSQGIEWSPYNWLQYPKDQSFVRLFE